MNCEYATKNPPRIARHLQAFLLYLDCEWQGDDPVEVQGFEWAGQAGPRIEWPQTYTAVEPTIAHPGDSRQFILHLPWTREFLRSIELARGTAAEVRWKLRFNAIYRTARENPESAREMLVATHARRTGQRTLEVVMPRDVWHRLLADAGFGSIEVFELPTRQLVANDQLAEGLQHLKGAERAFREGNYRSTIIEVRLACEAAAGVHDPEAVDSDAVGRAFSVFLEKLFDDAGDKRRRDAVDKIMQAIRDLRNHTAHYKFGGQPSRHDAEFALGLGLVAFRYVDSLLERDRG